MEDVLSVTKGAGNVSREQALVEARRVAGRFKIKKKRNAGPLNNPFGFKFTAVANLEDVQFGDWYQTLHRSTFWLASKAAA